MTMKIAVYRASLGATEVVLVPQVTTLTSQGLRTPRAQAERPGGERRRRMAATADGRAELAQGRQAVAEAMAEYLVDIAPLASLRMAAGLSQADVFDRVGILQPQLSRLENGRTREPSASTVERLADLYNVSMETVFQAIRKGCERASQP